MTERLFVYLDENWPEQPEVDWVVLDQSGAALRSGTCPPSGWPVADRLEGVIGGSQCLWLEIPLPLVTGKRKLKRADEAKLIANGLEEKIIDDPDSQHWVVTHRRSDNGAMLAGVLVISKQRLSELREALSIFGKQVDGFYSELQTCPWQEGECTLIQRGSDWIVRTKGNSALVLPEAILPDSLGQLASHDCALQFLMAPGQSDLSPGLLSHIDKDGRRIRCETYEWWKGVFQATNLLQGEFKQVDQRRSWLKSLRWPLGMLGFLLLAQLVVSLVTWSSDRLALKQIRGDMEHILATAAPGQPVVMPAQQLHQLLETETARHGQLRDGDLLALLATLSEVLGSGPPGLLQVNYDNRQMEITLSSEVESMVGGKLAERLAEHGLRAESKGGGHWRIFVQPIEE